MNLHDRWSDAGQKDDSLSWRLKSWVARHPSPHGGRRRLLETAGERSKARRNFWQRIYTRRIRPLLPNRAAVPFSAEDLICSVTMFSQLHSAYFTCV
jgi:hypothetical protein